MAKSEYDSYVRAEWQLFAQDSSRWSESLNKLETLEISRVLDVGCGAGQELLPFVVEKRALGFGVDLSPEVGLAGRELISEHYDGATIFFARATAEKLPFRSASFDLVICRVALPYMNNNRALAEMARVTRMGGALILKIHHWRYYLRDLINGLSRFELDSAVHAVRVLTVGSIYHLTGRQLQTRLTGAETFQTRWLVDRVLRHEGLVIQCELADSNPLSPAFLIRKKTTECVA
jgi:SAM-dependent methyltransferase